MNNCKRIYEYQKAGNLTRVKQKDKRDYTTQKLPCNLVLRHFGQHIHIFE